MEDLTIQQPGTSSDFLGMEQLDDQIEAVSHDNHIIPMNFPSNNIMIFHFESHHQRVSHLISMANNLETIYKSPVKGILDPIYISRYQSLLFSGKDYIKFLFRYSDFRRTARIGFFLFLAIFAWRFKTKRSKNQIHLADGLKRGTELKFICFNPARTKLWYILDNYTVLLESWIQILKCDQFYFPLPKPNSTEVRIETKTHIVARECRMAESEKLRIFGSEFLPLLSMDSPLLYCLLWFAHIGENPQNSILGLHLNPSTTENRLKKYLFSVTAINVGVVVRSFLNKCPGCLRTNPKHFNTVQGRNLMTLNYNILQFTRISIDPLGKVLCKITDQSDTLIHLVPLVICCLVTGAIMVVPMTGATRHQIRTAIQWLMIRTGAKVNLIVADHASVFKNLDYFLPGVRMKVCQPRSQHANRVERSIKNFRDIWRRMFRITPKEPGRNLVIPTWSELCMKIDLAVEIVNQIPYHQKSSGRDISPPISPDFFKNPGLYCLLSKEEFGRNRENIHLTLAAKIKEFISGCVAARNDSLLREESRFVGRRKTGIISPQIGDVCFVKSESTFERARLCQIIDLTTTSAKIRFADGKISYWSLKNLHPLSCFRGEKIFCLNPCNDQESLVLQDIVGDERADTNQGRSSADSVKVASSRSFAENGNYDI